MRRLENVFKGFKQGHVTIKPYVAGNGIPWIIFSVKGTILNVTDNTQINIVFKLMVTFNSTILSTITKSF